MKKYRILLKNCNEYAFMSYGTSRLNAAKNASFIKCLSLKAFLNIFTVEKL